MLYFISTLFLLISSFGFTNEKGENVFTLSTPEEIATLTASQEFLVGKIISPLSGSPVLRQTDLIVKGAQNIFVTRHYLGPHISTSFDHNLPQSRFHLRDYLRENYRGWKCFLQSRIQVVNGNPATVRLSEPNGLRLEFQVIKNGIPNAKLIGDGFGLSNFSPQLPSGKFDPHNTKILILEDGHYVIVYSPEGVIRHYRSHLPTFEKMNFCYLEKEILPNGKVLRYGWTQGNSLCSLESLDPQERYVYSSIAITYSASENNICFTSSDGNCATYHYELKKEHYKWKERHVKVQGECHFPVVLKSVSTPYFRNETIEYDAHFLLQSYSGKDQIFVCGLGEVASPSKQGTHYKVSQLFLPVGDNDVFLPTHELHYTPPDPGKQSGTTYVRHRDGTGVTYFFSPKLLLTAIQYFGKERELVKQQNYTYNDKNWLESTILTDGQSRPFYSRTFQYDSFGNPIIEIFSGDLTGEGTQESYTIQRTFSEDGRNLLLREEAEDGKVVCFSYLPNTDLITIKVVKNREKILLRECYEYDDCYNLIRKIEDDGSDETTQRLITQYYLRQNRPYLHMVEWIEKKYEEEGREKLLKKVHLHYNEQGNVVQEDHFDANEEFVYSILKTYNERGDLLSETNPLNQKATYTYDSRGRLETEIPFSQRIEKQRGYDLRGRLKRFSEKGLDNQNHLFSYFYDEQDHCKQVIDYLGNITSYHHDPVTGKVIQTVSPSIYSVEGGQQVVITQSTYDAEGRELTKTDANENKTSFRYNAYGSPTEIFHPSGSKETFRYYKNGRLHHHTDAEGLTITYQYDLLGRILSKTYSLDEPFAEETFTYNSFHLLKETDREDFTICYSYDKAGRKIREEKGGRTTAFFYDSLGRVSSICREGQLWIYYKRDLLDRVLEETQTDETGLVLRAIAYQYDTAGNRTEIIRSIQGNPAIEAFRYDSFDRLIEYIDQLGFVTKHQYDETYINSLNQRVIQKTSIDPNGIMTLSTQDTHGRTASREVFDPMHRLLASEEFFYDPCGNLFENRVYLIEKGVCNTTQKTCYSYDVDNHLITLIRGFGTADERIEECTYTPSGRRKTKTLPNGTSLSYSYDSLGYLNHLTSSDGTIDHTFENDRLGRLRFACTPKVTLAREMDPYGNIIKETWNKNTTISKTYDKMNRPLSIQLPDYSQIVYHYDPLFLREVTRFSETGIPLYSHRFNTYDLTGSILSESLMHNLGLIQHRNDLKNQKKSLQSPYFVQECEYDPCGNLITSIINDNKYSYTYDGLSQLTSEDGYVYTFDSNYNRTSKNNIEVLHNPLNELLSSTYDLNGNLTSNGIFTFFYDALNQLIQAKSDTQQLFFAYDPLGRRINKTVYTLTDTGWQQTLNQFYIYQGTEELGALAQDNEIQQLRVPGLHIHRDFSIPIALELEGKIYAVINDCQGNIRNLIDPNSRTLIHHYKWTAFGESLSEAPLFNPWCYASKRWDPELNLIYYGRRYYDPKFGHWLTIDPAGYRDSLNLYQYLLNNPLHYLDPDGQFAFMLPLLVWGAEVIVPSLTAMLVPALQIATLGAVGYAGYKTVQALNRWDNEGTVWPTLNISHKTASESQETKKKKPPYSGDELGEDPTKCPGEGFEWRGDGPVGSKQGSWYNDSTEESLYPDLDHPPPKKPHWDYSGPDCPDGARLNTDGTWEFK